MRETNIDNDDMAAMMLCKKGYGSLSDIKSWDTKQFLDALEYESICAHVEAYQIDQARSGNG